MVYFHVPFTLELALYPLFLIPLVLFTTAVGMLFAAMNVKYRDIKYTIPFFIQAMFFLSPVIYPPSIVPDKYTFLLRFNPMVGILDAFRASVLPTRSIDWGELGIASAITLVLLAVASVYFYRTERHFADWI
jgi:lipopolysaccharide transport system permease protein